MSLETYTGKIADLVVTNPQPTDPKSQGDDHLRGIKYTLQQSFPNFDRPTTQNPGQITPDTVQVGDSATASENHFWDGSVPNQLSLKRGTPEAPGAELIKALNGVLSFPQMPSDFNADNGSVTLPNGLILKWRRGGSASVPANTATQYTVTFGTPFPTACVAVVWSLENLQVVGLQIYGAQNKSVSSASCYLHNTVATTASLVAIAIGY